MMAKDCSFDVVSEFDKQELVNAIDQVKRDLTSRFDLKNSNSTIDLEADKNITMLMVSHEMEFVKKFATKILFLGIISL